MKFQIWETYITDFQYHLAAKLDKRKDHQKYDEENCITLPGAWLSHRRLKRVRKFLGKKQPFVSTLLQSPRGLTDKISFEKFKQENVHFSSISTAWNHFLRLTHLSSDVATVLFLFLRLL